MGRFLNTIVPFRTLFMRKTTRELLAEYGAVALVVYLSIFALVLAGFWAAIRLGWRTDSAAGTMGTLAAAYVATKVTQPLRIGATLVLTPLLAKAYDRVRTGGTPPASDA